MSKYTLQPPFARFSGTIGLPTTIAGQIIYKTTTGGGVARNRTKMPNVRSEKQNLNRSYVSQVAKAYSALPRATAQDWTDLAVTVKITNILGDNYELSGIALYQKINLYRLYAGVSISDTLPSTTQLAAPAGDLVITDLAGDVSLSIDDTALPINSIIFARMSAPLPGAARMGTESMCTTSPDSLDFSSDFSSVQADGFWTTFFYASGLHPTGSFAAALLQPLNADYFPGVPRLIKNVEVT